FGARGVGCLGLPCWRGGCVIGGAKQPLGAGGLGGCGFGARGRGWLGGFGGFAAKETAGWAAGIGRRGGGGFRLGGRFGFRRLGRGLAFEDFSDTIQEAHEIMPSTNDETARRTVRQ